MKNSNNVSAGGEDLHGEWSVYMVRGSDGSLYTGIAKNVEARLVAHNAGRASACTRARRPLTLVRREAGFTRSQALRREWAIKCLPKSAKELLVRGLCVSGSDFKPRVSP